jgi:hypothetical protein
MQKIWQLVVSLALVGMSLAGCSKAAPGPPPGKWGYISKKTGNFIIQPQFDEASNFSNGSAIVRDGKRLLRLQAEPPGESRDPVKPDDTSVLAPLTSLHAAQGAGDTYKVMDGPKVVFDVTKEAASDALFHDNDYICVQFGKKYAFIDKKGVVFQPPYNAARDFSEGRAAVQDGGKWGFINRKGKFVVMPQYLDAGSFVDGLAPVKIPAEVTK